MDSRNRPVCGECGLPITRRYSRWSHDLNTVAGNSADRDHDVCDPPVFGPQLPTLEDVDAAFQAAWDAFPGDPYQSRDAYDLWVGAYTLAFRERRRHG